MTFVTSFSKLQVWNIINAVLSKTGYGGAMAETSGGFIDHHHKVAVAMRV